MQIPPERLTEEVLRGIIESFISREGTDYGDTELSLDEKVSRLMSLVMSREVVIFYDEASESVNIVPRDEAESFSA